MLVNALLYSMSQLEGLVQDYINSSALAMELMHAVLH